MRDGHGGKVWGPEVCLVLHTSGTTKKPKIVPITWANSGSDVQFCRVRSWSAPNCLSWDKEDKLSNINSGVADVTKYATVLSMTPFRKI